MSCRKSVTGSLRGLLRRCISSTRTRRVFSIISISLYCRQQSFHSVRLVGTHVARSLRRRSLSSFNFYVMHQRQVLGHPPQLLDSAVVAFSAARPVRLLVRLFTPNGPASLPACHSNNGTHQGLTTRFWIHCWHIASRSAVAFTEELYFLTLSINTLTRYCYLNIHFKIVHMKALFYILDIVNIILYIRILHLFFILWLIYIFYNPNYFEETLRDWHLRCLTKKGTKENFESRIADETW